MASESRLYKLDKNTLVNIIETISSEYESKIARFRELILADYEFQECMGKKDGCIHVIPEKFSTTCANRWNSKQHNNSDCVVCEDCEGKYGALVAFKTNVSKWACYKCIETLHAVKTNVTCKTCNKFMYECYIPISNTKFTTKCWECSSKHTWPLSSSEEED